MPVKSSKKSAASAKAGKAAEVKEEPKVEDPEGEEEEEESDGDDSEEDAPPPAKKAKGQAAAPAAPAAPAAGGRGARGAAAKNMAFDKGTYIFRLSDLNLDPVKDCVWRVDNHQLLQRYNPEKPDVKEGGATRKYVRTQNYTGWMCQEGWDYIKLEVTGMYRNMGKEENVTVRYPTDAQIDKAKTVQEQKHKEQQDADQ